MSESEQSNIDELRRRKINFVFLIAALLLFLSPWSVLSCSGSEMMQQSGLQTITSDVSATSNLKKIVMGMGASTNSTEKQQDEVREELSLALPNLLALVVIIAGRGKVRRIGKVGR